MTTIYFNKFLADDLELKKNETLEVAGNEYLVTKIIGEIGHFGAKKLILYRIPMTSVYYIDD